MTLGQKICELRTQNSMTQEELGEKMGVSRQSVSKWETDNAVPEIDKIRQMCQLFNVSADYFILNASYESKSTPNEKSEKKYTFNQKLFWGLVSPALIVLITLFVVCEILKVKGFAVSNIELIVPAALMPLTVLLLFGKGAGLVAGYNTASDSQKQKYHAPTLCRLVGIVFLVVLISSLSSTTLCAILPQYCEHIKLYEKVLTVIIAVLLVIYANTSPRFRTKNRDDVIN